MSDVMRAIKILAATAAVFILCAFSYDYGYHSGKRQQLVKVAEVAKPIVGNISPEKICANGPGWGWAPRADGSCNADDKGLGLPR